MRRFLPNRLTGYLRWMLAALLVLLVTVLAISWIAGRQQTLQWAVQKALAGNDNIAVSGVSGSIYSRIYVAKIYFHNTEQAVTAERIELQLSVPQLLAQRLAVTGLKIDALTIEMLAPSKTPPHLPATLAPPFPMQIDAAQVGKITVIAQGSRTEINRLRLGLFADAKQLRLQDLHADTALGKLSASVTMSAVRPFALDGKIGMANGDAKDSDGFDAQLGGNLSELSLTATTRLRGAHGSAMLGVAPFEPQPLRMLRLKQSGINPDRWRAGLPAADLAVDLSARFSPDGVLDGKLALINSGTAGSLDTQRLPLRTVDMKLAGKLDGLLMQDLVLDLGAAGKFTGKGALHGALLALSVHTDDLNLKALNGSLHTTRIAGDIVLDASEKTQTLKADLVQNRLRLELDALLTPGLVKLNRARLRTGTADVQFTGEMNTAGAREFKAGGTVAHFNPSQLGNYPQADLNADVRLNGKLSPQWQVALDTTLRPSRLFNQSLTGKGKLTLDTQRIQDVDAALKLGGNQLTLRGSFGAPHDQLDWRIDAPGLQALGPQFGGALTGSGTLAGTRGLPTLSFVLDASNLKLFERHRIKTAHADGRLADGANGLLQAKLDIAGIESGDLKMQFIRLQANGNRSAHTIRVAARGESLDTDAELNGGWRQLADHSGWDGKLTALQNRGRFAFSLQGPAALHLSAEQASVADAVLKLPDGSITLKSLEKSGARMRTSGQAAGVPFSYLVKFSPKFSQAMGDKVDTSLTLGASWALEIDQAVNGSARVFREGGDITMRSELPVTLGLSTLEAKVDIVKNALRAQFDMNGTRAGRTHFEGSTQLAQQNGKWTFPADAPLALKGDAAMPSVAWLALLSGQPGLDLDGRLALKLSASGSVGSPQFSGELVGDKLALRWTDFGVRLRNGILRAKLDGDQLILQQLRFDGDEGTVTLDGTMRYADAVATMQMQLLADKLQLLGRPDRLLVVSGSSKLTLDRKRILLEGKFKADRAAIELADQEAPTLSDDVIVLGAPAKTKAQASLPFYMDLDLDLGERFSLKGKGLDARLVGEVRLTSVDSRVPRAIGTIQVAEGSFTAFGQKLQIERGLINFTGSLDNPGINILAMRKRPDAEQDGTVQAGVEVRGSALSPTAKLVSTPTVPDSEKLSWLILGHGTAGTAGQEMDLLGVAAGALFSGGQTHIASKLGLDEIGMSRAKGLETTVVTIGKRISSRAYLTYEQGAGTATTLVKLRYALSPRLSLQAQGGANNNALDLLYTWMFD